MKDKIKIKSFNGVSVNSNNLLVETKELLLDGYADWTPFDIGGLIFKRDTLKSFLRDNYFDDENTPSKECLKEIREIVTAMKDAAIFYLY